MKKFISIAFLVTVLPGVALAQVTDLSELLQLFQGIVTALMPFLVGLGVLFFVWGVLLFVTAGDDQEKRANGRSKMIYGVIAIFVMVSIWGLVNLLVTQFGLDVTDQPPPITPIVPTF